MVAVARLVQRLEHLDSRRDLSVVEQDVGQIGCGRLGPFGGITLGDTFVIAGDQNSDPFDGDSVPGSIQQLLDDHFGGISALDWLACVFSWCRQISQI